MEPKFYDPIGRECGIEAFIEWKSRIDLKTVRQFANHKAKVKLVWNDEPHILFGLPKVFVLEAKYHNGTEFVMSAVYHGKQFSTLVDAIEGFQACLEDFGCGTRSKSGVFVEDGNTLPPTKHELEFDGLDVTAAELDDRIEFEMPKLSPVEQVIEAPRVEAVGSTLSGFTDGADAW